MALEATCKLCGSRTSTLPHRCGNELCANFGLRIGSDFTPQSKEFEAKPRSNVQFTLATWFQFIAVLGIPFLLAHYLDRWFLIAAPMALALVVHAKVNGWSQTFFEIFVYSWIAVFFVQLLVFIGPWGSAVVMFQLSVILILWDLRSMRLRNTTNPPTAPQLQTPPS